MGKKIVVKKPKKGKKQPATSTNIAKGIAARRKIKKKR